MSDADVKNGSLPTDVPPVDKKPEPPSIDTPNESSVDTNGSSNLKPSSPTTKTNGTLPESKPVIFSNVNFAANF